MTTATRPDPLILSMSKRLGIVYCPVCKCDTLRRDSGRCGGCLTRICKPKVGCTG